MAFQRCSSLWYARTNVRPVTRNPANAIKRGRRRGVQPRDPAELRLIHGPHYILTKINSPTLPTYAKFIFRMEEQTLEPLGVPSQPTSEHRRPIGIINIPISKWELVSRGRFLFLTEWCTVSRNISTYFIRESLGMFTCKKRSAGSGGISAPIFNPNAFYWKPYL